MNARRTVLVVMLIYPLFIDYHRNATAADHDGRSAAVLAPSPFGTGDLGDYPEPVPVAVVPRAAEITKAVVQAAGQSAVTKAIELRVDSYRLAATLGDRQPAAGRSFLVVDTSWKNIIPLTRVEHEKPDRAFRAGGLGFGMSASAPGQAEEHPATMESTPYVVPDVPRHLWLLVDGRYAEPLDVAATVAAAGHLSPDRFTIRSLGEVLTGRAVFQVPGNAESIALLFLDTQYGSALVPIKGKPLDGPLAKTLSAPKQNELVELAVVEASWARDAPPPPSGMRFFSVRLRGTSRSADDIVELKFGDYAFLQTDQGFVAEPAGQAAWLGRPFDELAAFLPGAANEGDLAFLIPAETKQTTLLLRPPKGGPIDLAAPDKVKPVWPAPLETITDGTTLRLHRLPSPSPPGTLAPPGPEHRHLLLDIVVENLKPAQGIEFQPAEQLRVLDASGSTFAPAAETAQLMYRLSGKGVIPAGAARRFQLLYTVPLGQPLRLEYRGFERTEAIPLE